uniref:Transposase (Putative), gypsy type n=1 Tax=Tanacetum cinerariifolium TaxID=118510 RepID=A0A6L2P9H8_TANCI|nr:hypothetical protein [Tanacetum cinerariifolium]
MTYSTNNRLIELNSYSTHLGSGPTRQSILAATKPRDKLAATQMFQDAHMSCTNSSNETIFCTDKRKALALSWGRTPRLSSDVKRSPFIAICFFRDVSLCQLDPFPKSTEFNADDYAVLVAHPAPFRKFPEPFLCLIGISQIDLFAFIQVADLTKVKVKEREGAEREARLLDSTVGRVVPLLPFAPARAKSEMEASVGRLLDECGSADQNMAAERPKRPRKKRQAGTDADGSSYPLKKLKGDYGASSEVAIYGKSPSALREFLASSLLNVEVDVAVVPTLPIVTSSVSATPEHESGASVDSITGLNIRTIGASERFIISLDSSHHPSTQASEAEGDSIIRSDVVPLVMTEAVVTSLAVNIPLIPETGVKVTFPVHASLFQDSDFTETVLNDSLLDDYDVSHEFVDHLALPALFSHIHEMDYHHLFTEFNKQADLLKVKDAEIESLKAQLLLKEIKTAKAVHRRAQVSAFEATKKKHASEIDALKQKNVAFENEKGSLNGKVVELQSSVSTKDLELKELNDVVSSPRSKKDGLVDQVLSYERSKEHIEELQDAQMNIINDKVPKLDADLLKMALHLKEKFYPHLLNTISGRRWLLTHGLSLQLSTSIDHGKVGMSLEDVVAYNPSMEADYNFALQRLQEVDFPLLAELQFHMDESTTDVMDLLHLKGPLADAPGMNELQPNIKQLKLPIHRPEDQVILGETFLLVALDVTYSRVERIMENVTAQWSALISVWTPLVDPLSVENLVGAAGTSDSMLVSAATTTALSVTFSFASIVLPITIKDYEIIGTDGLEDDQGSGQGEAASFPNRVEFEKEELDTTPECNLPS